ncbi:hypothetical protein AS132_10880 [Photobacterium sanguinicancri]|nr:hypothetical protein AS132_10880 [Photobacterium sanguinicancri]
MIPCYKRYTDFIKLLLFIALCFYGLFLNIKIRISFFLHGFNLQWISVILLVSEGTDGTEQEIAKDLGSLRMRPMY